MLSYTFRSDSGSSVTTASHTFRYDAAGRLIYSSRIGADGNESHSEWTYDGGGRPLSYLSVGADGSTYLEKYEYICIEAA